MVAAGIACFLASGLCGARSATDEPAVGETTAPYAPESVTLPPYLLDAVNPLWTEDTRTAITSVIRPTVAASLSMVDALRGSAGVQIDQPGGPGGRSSIYIRGGEENYAVVLLDGVPLNDSTDSRGGGFDFGSLDATEIAAAEVVRGPVSARYGPDALSGVVKLTSDVLGPQADSRIAAAVGTGGQAQGYFLARTREDATTLTASAHWSEDGSRASGSFAHHDAVAAGATWQGTNLEWRLAVRDGRYESAAFPDDSGGPRLAVLRSLEERSGTRTTAEMELLSPGRQRGGVKWRMRAWGAWLDGHDDSPGVAPGLRDPAGLPASLEVTSLRRLGFSAEGAVEAGDHGMLAIGTDGEAEKGRSNASLIYGPLTFPASFAATRDRVGTFAEYTWKSEAGWLIQPSMRLDQTRGYGLRTTPRLGLRIPMGQGAQLRINAGTGFKLPSFYAVSNPLVGNPALKLEKAQTVDAAIERHLASGRVVVELGGFSSRYRDGIDFDPGPPPRLVNRSQIRSDGIEASVRVNLAASLVVTLEGAYVDARSMPDGGRLRGRPQTEGSIRAQWTPRSDLTFESILMVVGDVPDSSVPTGDIGLPGWCRMDLSARYHVRRDLSLIAAVANLFDAHCEEAVGMPSPGTRWRVGVEAKF